MKYLKNILVVLAAVSALTACGKKGDAPASNVVSSPAAVNTVGSGGCVTVSYNTAQTFTFSGSLQPYSTGIVAQLPAYGYGVYTAGINSSFHRADNSGDVVDVYISGSSAYAVVTISATTASAIVAGQSNGTYGGTGSICGLDINATFGNFGNGNTMSGVLKMWANSRWVTYPYPYQNTLILL